MSQPLFLQKLLQKSEDYRRKVAYIATAVIGLVIFCVWLFITSHSIKQAFQPSEGELKTAKEFQQNLFSGQNKTLQTTVAQPALEEKKTDEQQSPAPATEETPIEETKKVEILNQADQPAPTNLKIQNSFENLIKDKNN